MSTLGVSREDGEFDGVSQLQDMSRYPSCDKSHRGHEVAHLHDRKHSSAYHLRSAGSTEYQACGEERDVRRKNALKHGNSDGKYNLNLEKRGRLDGDHLLTKLGKTRPGQSHNMRVSLRTRV